MTDVFIGLFSIGYLGALIYFLQRARMFGQNSLGIILAFVFSPYAVVMGCYWLVRDLPFVTGSESSNPGDKNS